MKYIFRSITCYDYDVIFVRGLFKEPTCILTLPLLKKIYILKFCLDYFEGSI
jgi:hypothetical protein